jgi:predicted DCC family thiol-disulfide oxidoreductase YuxK
VADTLLFDGDCGFCSSWARVAQRIAPTVDVRPYQHTDLDAFGVTADECATALRWVGTGGAAAGAAAVARLLIAAAGWWGVLGRMLSLPGIRGLAALLYRAVAANRYRLPGGTPACRL